MSVCVGTVSILRRVIDLEVESRRPVGKAKKTCCKVVEEDTRKLSITKDMAEDIHTAVEATHISCPTPGVEN